MGKATKAEAGYQVVADCEYLCGQCVFLKPIKDGSGCAFFGPTVNISAESGSCNAFTHCDPKEQLEIPWIPMFNKVALGYMENKNGFGCRRCSELIATQNACKEVDKDSPGASPGAILPTGCCNFWGPDPKRSKMSTPALLQLMAGSKAHAIVRIKAGASRV